ISTMFTAGVRTTGRVESENRVTKASVGAKTSSKQLYDFLNERSSQQTSHELQRVRDHAGPYALHTCYEQMELSLTYKTEAVQLPEGIRHWHARNTFTNDKAYISTCWLLRLISNRGLQVKHLLRVTHIGTSTVHYVAILVDGLYICDCCMGLNLGIPCHHFFQILLKVPSMQFHIGLVRARCVIDFLEVQLS
ncbi:hypothetical protein FPV67DRAFT_1423234, partial [Lyophyllum atratum]